MLVKKTSDTRAVRTFLTVREAAFLLQASEMTVRRRVASGALALAGQWATADGRQRCRVSPESLTANFPADGTYRLRRLLLGAILSGRLVVPTAASRWGTPASLETAAEALRG